MLLNTDPQLSYRHEVCFCNASRLRTLVLIVETRWFHNFLDVIVLVILIRSDSVGVVTYSDE
jgi:hypothetical protein